MGEPWCEVMDMASVGCAHCRPVAERKRLDTLAAELELRGGNTAPPRTVKAKGSSVWTIARIGGSRCGANCDRPIEIGDEIVKADNDRWCHLDCVEY